LGRRQLFRLAFLIAVFWSRLRRQSQTIGIIIIKCLLHDFTCSSQKGSIIQAVVLEFDGLSIAAALCLAHFGSCGA